MYMTFFLFCFFC